MKDKQQPKEVNINGSRVYVENGEVKTQLSEAILQSGYMTVEEAKQLTLAAVEMIYELNGAKVSRDLDNGVSGAEVIKPEQVNNEQ